jgi:hypothetical protein
MKETVGYCVRWRKPNGEYNDYGGRYLQPWPLSWQDTRYVWPTLNAAKCEVMRRGYRSWKPGGHGFVFFRVVRKVRGGAS